MRFCLHPRCPKKVDRGYCDDHRRDKPSRNLLKTYKWQQLRKRWLNEHPLCHDCQHEEPSRVSVATEVHHIRAHRGDATLCFSWANLMSLCHTCHGIRTGRGE